jgi:hypothetical protein
MAAHPERNQAAKPAPSHANVAKIPNFRHPSAKTPQKTALFALCGKGFSAVSNHRVSAAADLVRAAAITEAATS